MSDLNVYCDSVNHVVEFKNNSEILCKMEWGEHEDNIGFFVENSKILMRVYDADFYVLDEAATMCFLINAAFRIKQDQGLDKINYFITDGEEAIVPIFLPYTVEDYDIAELSNEQLMLCKLWNKFCSPKVLNYFLGIDLLDIIPNNLLQAFFDIFNAEINFFRQFGEVRSDEI